MLKSRSCLRQEKRRLVIEPDSSEPPLPRRLHRNANRSLFQSAVARIDELGSVGCVHFVRAAQYYSITMWSYQYFPLSQWGDNSRTLQFRKIALLLASELFAPTDMHFDSSQAISYILTQAYPAVLFDSLE